LQGFVERYLKDDVQKLKMLGNDRLCLFQIDARLYQVFDKGLIMCFDSPMDTSALVVPDSADNTTILGSVSLVIKSFTWCIRSGFPTEVPPNFIIFITVAKLKLD
jgi:hypothetical protein